MNLTGRCSDAALRHLHVGYVHVQYCAHEQRTLIQGRSALILSLQSFFRGSSPNGTAPRASLIVHLVVGQRRHIIRATSL